MPVAYPQTAVALTIPKTPWVFSGTGLTYRKEVIYTADFANGDVHWSVDEAMLYHWVATFEQMVSAGQLQEGIPMPLLHTSDPDKRRAWARSLEVALNSEGLPALFATVEFRDLAAVQDLRESQVSLYSPPEVEVRVEYTFNWEDTGGSGAPGPSSVDNNELMVELLLEF